MSRLATVLVVAAMALAADVVHGAATIVASVLVGHQAPVLCADSVKAKMFVPNYADGTLSVIDTATLLVTATVPVGANPRRLVCNEATHRVYVVNATTPGTLTVVDATTNAVVATVAVGADPRTVGANFLVDEVYVANFGSGTLSVVDTKTNAVVATIPVGTGPGAPTSNDRLHRTYVPSATDGTVTVIDQPARAVAATVKVGNGPQYAAVDGRHGKVYVNNVTDRTMSVIDGATNAVVTTLPTGAGTSFDFPSVNGAYRRAYLPNATDNTLTVIDTDTDTVVATIPVGASPVDALADATTGDLYVVNQGGNSVTIVDAATDAVIGTLAVGGGPTRVFELGERLYVLNANGSNRDSVTVATKQGTIVGTAIATELYHAGFDHYFHTADETEARLLRDGLFDDDWHRTFEFWRVWSAPGPGRSAVCRFFSASYAPKSSHFYTPYAAECASLQAGGVWQLESTAVFYLMLPDATGACPAGTAPLYRTYNDGKGDAPNHRYTASRALRDQMVLQGWTAEGSGPDTVFACTPTLKGG